ncbi:MAG: metalloregulator ArsR/SmtB family transcription factor [Bacteroidetes bacterium]|nr:metalloregulator ArsR/SmtB family transcription factor [Bacteroidota bacterium]MDA1122375.1 metalloregulator ArsR/SmtB family transcription factor [Bacteroidota bacterium]
MNNCIRVLADVHQIKECREDIQRIKEKTKPFSRLFALAGNEVRLHILYLLHREGQMCPCDLSDVLGMNVSPISQHLRKLKDAGIVTDKKVGQTIFYSLEAGNISPILPIIKSLKTDIKETIS